MTDERFKTGDIEMSRSVQEMSDKDEGKNEGKGQMWVTFEEGPTSPSQKAF